MPNHTNHRIEEILILQSDTEREQKNVPRKDVYPGSI